MATHNRKLLGDGLIGNIQSFEMDLKKYGEETHFYTINGFKVSIKRNSLGNNCGDIYLPEDHRYFGKSHDDINQNVEQYLHGGLTTSQMINGEWVIGFDTSRPGDWTPVKPNLPLKSIWSVYDVLELFQTGQQEVIQEFDNQYFWTHGEVFQQLTNFVVNCLSHGA